MKTIELNDELFKRLESKAVGFDTPEMVIKRLLDEVDGHPQSRPEIIFEPSNEDEFKKKLIEKQKAKIVLYKTDGSKEVINWNAKKFNETSNLRANLWSGYLRDWKEKNILKAELFIS
jgi:hypothetical protein